LQKTITILLLNSLSIKIIEMWTVILKFRYLILVLNLDT